MCLAKGPQCSDPGEAQNRGPSVWSQALYHWATPLPNLPFTLFKSFIERLWDSFPRVGRAYNSKTCVERPLSKRPTISFQDQLLLNAGQKYCRMLQVEHSAILSTFIKLPFVIKIFILSIIEWPFYSGLTVFIFLYEQNFTTCVSSLSENTFKLLSQDQVNGQTFLCLSWSSFLK